MGAIAPTLIVHVNSTCDFLIVGQIESMYFHRTIRHFHHCFVFLSLFSGQDYFTGLEYYVIAQCIGNLVSQRS